VAQRQLTRNTLCSFKPQTLIRILIIRFSSIGDIILTTPVVRCLKNQLDNIEIHFLVKKQYSFLLENNPNIKTIHYFDNNLKDIIHTLRLEQFDYIIDLQKNFRSLRVKNALGIPSFSFPKLNFEKWLLVNVKINKLPKKHIVDRYLEATMVFDIINDEAGLDYFLPREIKLNPQLFEKPFIVLVAGAKHFTKQIPQKTMTEICDKVEVPIYILGDSSDAPKADNVVSLTTNPNVVNLCGKLSFDESAYLVKTSKLVISSDTGLMHVAAAFKKHIISIWGNTIPEFGMYPYLAGNLSEIIEVKELKCRPCSKIGFRKCPSGHFRCMNDINVSKIITLANQIYRINEEHQRN
jgi:ADP-heptose:LPS heptosyltransferase